MAAKKEYITVRIENLARMAAQRLGLHGDDLGARALHSLISEHVEWEEVEKEAETLKKTAKRHGVL